ncbi:ATP-binding cassette domain-containing protein [Streptomyces sp. NPDC086549]|uniref:ATP-binding cassette domain-containing protein n=1 Tax=Streptomyces sp. NPDC086549 TaxID=3365752 RepID=UPI00381739B1
MSLHVTDLRHAYGKRQVLRGVTFDVPDGVLAGVVGENGAGKTTLLRILSGELTPAGGAATRTGSLGYCPQQAVLNHQLTVAQHLRYFQVAYRLGDLRLAEELLDVLSFAQYRNERVSTLSGGTRQKLNLTLALMHDPDLVLLDEPYQGFDWDTYLRFWDLAQRLRRRGRSVLVISHLAHDADRLDTLHRLEAGTLQPGTETLRGQ